MQLLRVGYKKYQASMSYAQYLKLCPSVNLAHVPSVLPPKEIKEVK